MNLHINIERAEITILPSVPTSELIVSTLEEKSGAALSPAAETFTVLAAEAANVTPRFVVIDGEGMDGGIVVDTRTGLQWSREDVSDDALNHAAATAACTAFRLHGHNDWRMPSREELESLLDLQRHEPSIDTNAFPTCKSAYYWTSTDYKPSPSCAWCVGFYHGYVGYGRRVYGYRVRAVRGPVRQ